MSSTPRYEFRIWVEPDNPAIDALRRRAEAAGEDARTDIYILSDRLAGRLPKIRGRSAFEIKQRIDAPEPLERWTIGLRAPFPMTPAQAARARTLLSDLNPASGPLDSAADAVLCFGHSAYVAETRKHRAKFRTGRCLAEITRVEALGHDLMTLALESEDPDAVLALAQSIGIAGYRNLNYGHRLLSLFARANGTRAGLKR